MIIEHITLLTSHVLKRDTADILPTTERLLRPFSKLTAGQHVLDIDKTPFSCRVTLTEEGALFDLLLQDTDSLLFTNVCCFNNKYQFLLLDQVKAMTRLPLLKNSSVIQPRTDEWLYTIPIAPYLGTPDQLSLAGEIEFYIWNSLFKANQKLNII